MKKKRRKAALQRKSKKQPIVIVFGVLKDIVIALIASSLIEYTSMLLS